MAAPAGPSTSTLRHVAWRLRRLVRPAMQITAPPSDVRLEQDVEVRVRDGVTLRVNVFRPTADPDQPRPVLMCAHPYGKDAFPKPKRRGNGFRPPFQARMIPQSLDYTISAYTTWEGPDPAYWVPRGYVVVNADLRGWGRSDGVGQLLSEQEGLDYHDLIEWAAAQSWSNGRVGLTGVSYLAISQWAAAATQPPHLAAICPWEGFTDLYRDFARPGGVREDGFVRVWSAMMGRQRRSPVDLRREQKARPYIDDWYAARNRDIERIDTPALICGSFSDHNLHSRGSFEGYRRIASDEKWLYTHRGPKWSTYYSPEALAFQQRFFDCFLKGDDNGFRDEPPVRVEIREYGNVVAELRHEDEWPPAGTAYRSLHLDPPGVLSGHPVDRSSSVSFDTRGGVARFSWRPDADIDLVGPMALRLHIEVVDADDVFLLAGVRKRRDGRVIGFEGSYGFPDALVTYGWLKASHRHLDTGRSRPGEPEHEHTASVVAPTRPDEIVVLDLALLPQATRFRAGDELELCVQGQWPFAGNPFTGQFPARYERSPGGRCVIHCGGSFDSLLEVPHRP